MPETPFTPNQPIKRSGPPKIIRDTVMYQYRRLNAARSLYALLTSMDFNMSRKRKIDHEDNGPKTKKMRL